jgi:AcrR family transcriptional regulator
MEANEMEETAGPGDERRKSIIDAAERVFLRVDFPSASMSAIAEEAGISRPTLYKYFPSLDELALEVEMRALEALYSSIPPHLESKGSGLERVEGLLKEIVGRFEENRAHIRFSGLFDHYYHEAYPSEAMSARYDAFLGRFDEVERLVEEGKADGSIRQDMDSHNAAYAAGNIVLAFMQRMASRKEVILREQRVDLDSQFETMIRMILDYAAATGRAKEKA